jgi:hypothetical protein
VSLPLSSILAIGNGTINAEVTGRTTQIEVNADGTKTMKTGGTKTVYSWDTDKGGMSQKTDSFSRTSRKAWRVPDKSS